MGEGVSALQDRVENLQGRVVVPRSLHPSMWTRANGSEPSNQVVNPQPQIGQQKVSSSIRSHHPRS